MIKKVIEKEYPGATIGTLEQTGTEKYGGGDSWVICVKGYYYPKDEYGQVKSKKLFEKYYNGIRPITPRHAELKKPC